MSEDAPPIPPLSELPELAGFSQYGKSEAQYYITMLRLYGWNISRTADRLGISRQYIHRVIKMYKLDLGKLAERLDHVRGHNWG